MTEGRLRRIESAESGRNATADRAMDLLLLFTDQRYVLSAADVARELGLSRSTTYRYLQSLRSYGFLEEDVERGGFRLGPTVFELGRVARKGLGLSEIALPVMRELARRLEETVLLTRRVGAQAVTIERVESGSHLHLSYERGHVLPIHAGASARVLIAFETAAEIDEILATTELRRFTDRTITDPDEFRKELRRIRERGYAVSRGEVDVGVIGVAAPIFDMAGRPVAGLTAVTLEVRVGRDRVREMADAVRKAADEISQRLQVVEA